MLPSEGPLTFYRRQAQLPCDFRVPDLARVIQAHPADQLRQVAAARDRTSTAERLEFHIADRVRVGVDPDLEFHHVATGRGTDETGPDVGVRLGHGPNIAGLAVVVEQ